MTDDRRPTTDEITSAMVGGRWSVVVGHLRTLSPCHPLSPALYLVATPIGHPEDITLRALRVLSEVDLIVAEDTRVTRVLLEVYRISTPLTPYQQHTHGGKSRALVEQLKQGARLALVSDAGMPGISDPGAELVRGAIEAGVRVVPVPGPTALILALAASGLPAQRFRFEGFPPRASADRAAFLSSFRTATETLVLYESPHRLRATLQDLREILGNRRAVVARELSKAGEEFIRGTLDELRAHFADHAPEGQCVVVVEGAVGTGA